MLKAQSDLLRSWAYLDGLTGVHNRRYFDEHLSAEMGRAIRNHSAMSLVMLDVDFSNATMTAMAIRQVTIACAGSLIV